MGSEESEENSEKGRNRHIHDDMRSRLTFAAKGDRGLGFAPPQRTQGKFKTKAIPHTMIQGSKAQGTRSAQRKRKFSLGALDGTRSAPTGAIWIPAVALPLRWSV